MNLNKTTLYLFLLGLILVPACSFAAEDFFPLNTWVEVKTSKDVNEQLKLSSGKKYNWVGKVRLTRGKKYSLQTRWTDTSGRKVGVLAYNPYTYDGRKIISGPKTHKWQITITNGENKEHQRNLDFMVSEHSLTDLAYIVFCHKFPGKSLQIMLSDKIDEGKKIKGAALLLKDMSGKNSSETSESSDPSERKNVIEILSWNAGGGNFMSPKIAVSLKVHCKNAHMVKLTALDSQGKATELVSENVTVDSPVNLSAKYSRMNTRFLEIAVFDKDGSILDSHKKPAK